MKRLCKGDCIGVCSTSSPTNADDIARLTAYFETWGFQVKVAPHTLLDQGYMAGSARERTEDFNALVADKSVNAIMTANGGTGAIQIIPLLDYQLIHNNPKIICGLSDPTSVLNAITAKTGVHTFHGPNGYYFGHKTPTPFTELNWWRIVTGDHDIPYSFPVASEMSILKGATSVAEGPIMGGNLRSLVYLLGSEYMPSLDNCILFIEEIGMQIHNIEALLNQLIMSHSLQNIAALIIGQLVDCVETDYNARDSWQEMVLRTFEGYEFPIVSNIPLGHTNDKITIPLGCIVHVDISRTCIQLLESPFE